MPLIDDVKEFARSRRSELLRVGWVGFYVMILGVIGYQVWKNWQEIQDYPWRLNWPSLLLAFALYTLSLALTALVWSLIMKSISEVDSFWVNLRLFCTTNLARRLPTPLWHWGARTVAYRELGVARSVTLTATAVEMIVTNVGGWVVALVTLPVGIAAEVSAKVSWALVLLAPLVVVVLKPNLLLSAVNAILVRLGRQQITALLRTRDMVCWVGLFLVIFANGGLLLYVVTNGVFVVPRSTLPAMINIFAISWLAASAGQLVFFLPNMGIRQVALAYLLSFHLPWAPAIAVALLMRITGMVFEVFWAIVLTRTSLKIGRKRS